MLKLIYSFLLLIIFNTNVMAVIISDIDVVNNERVSKKTIINFSKIDITKDIQNNDINAIIKNLYETNFFSDVKVKISKNKLIISVTENKIVNSIIINGVKAEKFREAILDAIKIKEKSPYIEFLAALDIKLINESLFSQGFYFSNVSSFISDNDNGTIDITYDVILGEKALLKSIEFTGDKVFKSRKLRNIITSEENKFWKFISNKKFLNERQLDLDKRLLKNFYLNNGYYNVQISSVFAKILDSGDFNVVFNINAGNVYKINNTKLILPPDYDVNNFSKINQTLDKIKNTNYSFNKLSKIVDQIDSISLRQEYEFINADIDEVVVNDNLIDLTITISESVKQYVERINILGNNVTLENVIRNQLAIDEGDPFNELLQSKSVNNLKSLNIFKNVTADIKKGSTDLQKIIDITVEEKPTGEISVGAGVGNDGGTLGFSLSENNYLGKGIKLNSSLKLGEDTIRGQFSIVQPNFRYSDRALFTSISRSSTDKLTTNGYKSELTAFSLGTRYEQYDDLYFSPTISSVFESLTTSGTASSSLKKQEGSDFDTNFSYALDYDKRNQRFMTTDGFKSKFRQSIPLISETYSIENGYEFDIYNKLDNEMVTKISFFASTIDSLKNEDVKVSQRLKLPRNRLKGFEYGKVRPVDNGDFVGGNKAVALSFSTTLPNILETLDDADISYFFDIGNVWGVDYSSAVDNSNTIRSSTGVSVNWYTVIGPLNFSLAQPITKADSDVTQTFQFNLGTNF